MQHWAPAEEALQKLATFEPSLADFLSIYVEKPVNKEYFWPEMITEKEKGTIK